MPAFAAIDTILYPSAAPEVVATAARALAERLGCPAPHPAEQPGEGLHLTLADGPWPLAPAHAPAGRTWLWARITAEGTGELVASSPSGLYALVHWLFDGLTAGQHERLAGGVLLEVAFDMNRPLYDTVLTQVGRTARRFDAEAYVERLAAGGFTHLEVNALATHVPLEVNVPTEYYSQFYSYCAALTQFVDSAITRGLYPHEYLAANLNRLKKLAALGRRYGLKPGILCFEPRTLPERFFERYPTLRGARVDHPFRSHHPRYTMAQDHPATRAHYREMMARLLDEVPDLSYMSVWTNDSGAGFEHTASLYVGRNGGPYLIREWRSHEKIAEAAGQSAVRWLRLLQETAAEVNPDFEVVLRIEPFKVEHDTILNGMGDGLTIEAPSLLVRGYHLPYRHVRYPEQESVAGTVYHTTLEAEEQDKLAAFRARDIEPKLTYSAGASFNMEPLLGIPHPRLLHAKLTALREAGFHHVSAFGGLLNLEKTPYWPNPEVIRAVQFGGANLDLDAWLHRLAARWVGETHADALALLWDQVDEAVSYMPNVPLYGAFGFVWLRTWVRPLVPNLEAIPEADRLYYERYLVSTRNNPAINDLGRDVLFDLITQESGAWMARQFDEHVRPRLDAVLHDATRLADETGEAARPVFSDLRDRIRALRIWATTQRNTCAWVAGVYGYLAAGDDDDARARYEADVQAMIDLDLANTADLLDLWETSDTEFILVSDVGETSFVYGDNLSELLRRKISLTEQYRHVPPAIDRDILWRLA